MAEMDSDPWGETEGFILDAEVASSGFDVPSGPRFASSFTVFIFIFAIEMWRLFGEIAFNAIAYHARHAIDPDVAAAQSQQQKVSQLRKEHAATTPMDEFAKWARLDRALTKETAALKDMMGKTKSTSSRVSYAIKALVYSAVILAYAILIYQTSTLGDIVYQFDPTTLGPGLFSFILRQPTREVGSVSVFWFAVMSHVVSHILWSIAVVLGSIAWRQKVGDTKKMD